MINDFTNWYANNFTDVVYAVGGFSIIVLMLGISMAISMEIRDGVKRRRTRLSKTIPYRWKDKRNRRI